MGRQRDVQMRWRATGPDGVGHAFHGSLPHASCGARNQPERFDWPIRERCPECRAAEEVRQERKAS